MLSRFLFSFVEQLLLIINSKIFRAMKKKMLFVAFMVLFVSAGYSQLKVENNGKVGVKVGSSTLKSDLAIGTVGGNNTKVAIEGNSIGLNVSRKGYPNLSWIYSVLAGAEIASNSNNLGVRGQALASSPKNSGRAWGVYGLAGNSTSGYNYGVFGSTYGYQNGAGIVGTVSSNENVNVPGIYAGYFVGNVKVEGTISAYSIQSSDLKYKKNIQSLQSRSNTALSKMLQLNPIAYNLKQIYRKSVGDSISRNKGIYDEKSEIFQKRHYGLIAQELQKIYPDLVYKDGEGFLGINYTELIPVLIQSIKELKQEVDVLRKETSSVKTRNKIAPNFNNISSMTNIQATLYQNTPNPFREITVIKYAIPETAISSVISIYDLNGKLLKTIPLKEKGENSIEIAGGDLYPGLFNYTLIVDGELIDTKRMVLTQ